jgi:hypothetical protein
MILRSIMKNDVWLTELGGHDLNLSPTETAKAGTERLGHCLFCREARCKPVYPTAAELDFRCGEDTLEEPVTSEFDGALKLLELYSINARPNYPSRTPIRWHELAPKEGTGSIHGLTLQRRSTVL